MALNVLETPIGNLVLSCFTKPSGLPFIKFSIKVTQPVKKKGNTGCKSKLTLRRSQKHKTTNNGT